MRPQRNAAENECQSVGLAGEHAASMRPQRNAAENLNEIVPMKFTRAASMRPQRNAAENVCDVCGLVDHHCRFNEAAA